MATVGSGAEAARELGQGWKMNPCIILEKEGQKEVLADVKGQGAIKHIWMTERARSRMIILRIYFDGQERPSVEAPLSDFFCNADPADYHQLSSLAMCVNSRRALNCYFEMPYFQSFKIEIEYLGNERTPFFYQIDCEEKEIPAESLYFHAQFRRVNPLPYKAVYTILDGVKGKGHYVGTYMYWGTKQNGWWGEGEIKFYLDGDSEFPTICGTGTEDYFCGAWSFTDNKEYLAFSSPYSGFYKVSQEKGVFTSQKYFDMYRWHITDPIYFEKDIKVTIQALGWRSEGRYLPLQDDISTVAYWYSDCLEDEYPPFPGKNELEIV